MVDKKVHGGRIKNYWSTNIDSLLYIRGPVMKWSRKISKICLFFRTIRTNTLLFYGRGDVHFFDLETERVKISKPLLKPLFL